MGWWYIPITPSPPGKGAYYTRGASNAPFISIKYRVESIGTCARNAFIVAIQKYLCLVEYKSSFRDEVPGGMVNLASS
jgi:hypothetical protein